MAQARRTAVAVPEGMVLRQCAYRFRLDPTPRQERALLRYAGARRYAYNWAVSYFRAIDTQRRVEREQTGEATTRQPSFIALNNAFNAWKRGDASVLPERWTDDPRNATSASAWLTAGVASSVLLWGIYEARDGLADHFVSLTRGEWVTRWKRDSDGVRRKRRRPRVEFPTYKARRRDRVRFKVTGPAKPGGVGGPIDRTHIALPTPQSCADRDLLSLRRIHARESMRRLWKAIHAVDHSAAIKNTTVSRDRRGHWWVVFSVEQLVPAPRPTKRMSRNGAAGADLGVRQLAALSTGHTVPAMAALTPVDGKVRAVDRAISRARKGSANQRRLYRRKVILLARAVDLRRDALHKTTTILARSFATVAIEDLNVAGMTSSSRGSSEEPGSRVRQKAGLNRRILDSSFAEFRRQLEYKTTWYGGHLHVVDRYAPTSKTCSVCGWRHPSLTLSERVFACTSCGTVADRDINAAANLYRLATGRSAPAQGGHLVSLRRPPATWRAPAPQALTEEPGTTEVVPTGLVDETGSPPPQGDGVHYANGGSAA